MGRTTRQARQNTARTHITGRWLLVSRITWLLIVLVSIGFFVTRLPTNFAGMRAAAAGYQAGLAQIGISQGFFAGYVIGMEIVIMLGYSAIALLIFRQRSDDWIATALSIMLFVVAASLTGVMTDMYRLGEFYLPNNLAVVFFLLAILIPYVMALIFPNGRFIPNWSRWLILPYAVILGIATFDPFGTIFDFLFMFLLAVTIIGAQVYRHQRIAELTQKQQTKWVVFGIAITAIITVLYVTPLVFVPAVTQPGFARLLYILIGGPVFTLAMLLVPLSFAFSIMRYGLWEVDTIINRSVVYVSLTALMGLAFALQVILLQWVLNTLLPGIQQSEFVLVASTLVTVALINPVRQRIQTFIDRRLYRGKIDLAQELTDFSREIRTIIDLSELLDVLIHRMIGLWHVSHGGMFLRGPDGQFHLAHAHNLPEDAGTARLDDESLARLESNHPILPQDNSYFNLLIPLISTHGEGSGLIGALALGPRLSGQGYSTNDINLLMGMADQVSGAINVALLIKGKQRLDELLGTVVDIGVMLSSEKNFNRLLENILIEAQTLCNADAGTLYLQVEDELHFVFVRNQSLNMVQGGSTGKEIAFPPLPLYDQAGNPNHNNVATHTALTGESVHIPNAYTAKEFDFSGTKKFDDETGYKSLSFLCVPLRNERGKVTGVLQLINAQNPITGEVIPFDLQLLQVVESLSSLASVALVSYIREQTLRQEIEKLRIEIDQSKQAEQVAEITDTEYFQTLKEKLQDLRERRQS